MSRFPTEPIGHVTPRPPIEINPRCPVTTGGDPNVYRPCSADESQRIWQLVVNAAQGSNVADAIRPEVDTAGWDAA